MKSNAVKFYFIIPDNTTMDISKMAPDHIESMWPGT